MLDFCSLQLLPFLPIIIEVENGCIWKVASTGGTHFYLPWLWEKEYLPWPPSSLFAFGRPKRRQVKHHFEQQILWLSVRYQTTKSPLRPSKTFKYSIWNQDFAINKHGIILTIYSPFSESLNDVQQLCYETSSNFGGCCFICPCRILEANSVRLWTNMGSRACKAILRLIWSKSSAIRRKLTMCWRFISWHSSMPAKPQVISGFNPGGGVKTGRWITVDVFFPQHTKVTGETWRLRPVVWEEINGQQLQFQPLHDRRPFLKHLSYIS